MFLQVGVDSGVYVTTEYFMNRYENPLQLASLLVIDFVRKKPVFLYFCPVYIIIYSFG